MNLELFLCVRFNSRNTPIKQNLSPLQDARCIPWIIDLQNPAIYATYWSSPQFSSILESRYSTINYVFLLNANFICIVITLLQNQIFTFHILIGLGKCTPCCVIGGNANDPSAGSPTETLLRLLLPLNNKNYQMEENNLSHYAISKSDGRYEQKAGTNSALIYH